MNVQQPTYHNISVTCMYELIVPYLRNVSRGLASRKGKAIVKNEEPIDCQIVFPRLLQWIKRNKTLFTAEEIKGFEADLVVGPTLQEKSQSESSDDSVKIKKTPPKKIMKNKVEKKEEVEVRNSTNEEVRNSKKVCLPL